MTRNDPAPSGFCPVPHGHRGDDGDGDGADGTPGPAAGPVAAGPVAAAPERGQHLDLPTATVLPSATLTQDPHGWHPSGHAALATAQGEDGQAEDGHGEDVPAGDDHRDGSLLGAALTLASQLDITVALRNFVDRAARLTGARYAALGVLDSRGETSTFVQVGMDAAQVELLGRPPRGQGLLAAIPFDGPLLLEDLTKHPEFGGFPEGHPDMHSFLGVPVRVHDQVYGRLYMAEKPGGFTAQDAADMMSLAEAAAVAVENSRLYAEARSRERWISVSRDITTALLEGTEEEEALVMIAARLREVAEADTALIILPSVGTTWACEIADGDRASTLVGLVFPPDGRAMTVLREGTGMIVDSFTRLRTLRLPELAQFGPALYAPMMLRAEGHGVILLLRRIGGPEFAPADLAMAESVAGQAALALELAAARHAQDVASLLDERARIGRDLHDLAIQQLFASGMQLASARTRLDDTVNPELVEVLEDALTSVDESVRQIRAIVHSLREPDAAVVLVERLRREASAARTSLGYAPSLVIDVDGTVIGDDGDEDELVTLVDDRVGSDIADDVVAVVREGLSNAARHARASSVLVRVSVLGHGFTGRVIVDIVDDGAGVDPAVVRRSGLGNLAARARRHGGTFSMGVPESGQGSQLSWQVPLT